MQKKSGKPSLLWILQLSANKTCSSYPKKKDELKKKAFLQSCIEFSSCFILFFLHRVKFPRIISSHSLHSASHLLLDPLLSHLACGRLSSEASENSTEPLPLSSPSCFLPAGVLGAPFLSVCFLLLCRLFIFFQLPCP